MKIQRWLVVPVLVLTYCVLLPPQVLACACCSSEGDYYDIFEKPDDYYVSLLQEMRFGRTANLILSEAGIEEDGRGLANPAERYSVTGSFLNNAWKVSFRSGKHSGTLTLPLPEKMWNHVADIHDGKLSPGGGPLLYKEWRFEGKPVGTGIFKDGITNDAIFSLVFQGRGNGCHNSEDFKHWRLAIRGENTRYAFTGRLGRPTASARVK